MSPIGNIALATICGLEEFCKNEKEFCKKVEEDLEDFVNRLDEIGRILFDEEKTFKPLKKLHKLRKKIVKTHIKEYIELLESHKIPIDQKFLNIRVEKEQIDGSLKDCVSKIKKRLKKVSLLFELQMMRLKEVKESKEEELQVLNTLANELYELVTLRLERINDADCNA